MAADMTWLLLLFGAPAVAVAVAVAAGAVVGAAADEDEAAEAVDEEGRLDETCKNIPSVPAGRNF